MIDALQERFGFYLRADLLYSNPAHALLTDTTTGGWVGRETIDGKACDHVAFQDRGSTGNSGLPLMAARCLFDRKQSFHQKRIRKFEIASPTGTCLPRLPQIGSGRTCLPTTRESP